MQRMAETAAAMNKTSRLDFWWPLTFGVTIGVEIMLSALVLFGPVPIKPELAATLTNQGRMYVVPENDLLFYAGGCVLTVLLTAGFAWLWRNRVNRRAQNGDTQETPAAFWQRGCANLSVAVALFLLHLGLVILMQIWWRNDGVTFPGFPVVVLAAPVMAAFLIATVGASWDLGLAPGWLVRRASAPPPGHEFGPTTFSRGPDLLVPILICALIYIPEWRAFFGRYFQASDWCRHWSSFVVGPMLAFHYGKALGTEAYSQYGVGWAVVFSALHSISPMTIPRFVHAAMGYGCGYFIGVYVFLRLVLRDATWATAGVLLAISLQVFHGLLPNEFLWEWPSSTVLRCPMDIWFFISLFLHLRTGRTVWGVAVGAFTGLAVFFETDTGIHLAITFVAYWTLMACVRWQAGHGFSTELKQAAISLMAAIVALLTGLAIASRGTLLRPEFWTGWLEAILTYGGGMSLLPIAKVPPWSLALFALFITVYLGMVGLAVIKLLHRALTPNHVLLACLGGYGLMALLLYVGRSYWSKMFHPSVPLSLIVIMVAAQWHQQRITTGADCLSGDTSRVRKSGAIPVPWCALGIMVAWLVANPVFRHYPGAVQRVFAGSPMQNVKGPPAEDEGFIPEFAPVISLLRQHISAGRTVAVLDDMDTVFYLAAGTAPWWRFSPCFSLMIRKSEVADLQHALVTRGPDVVVIRATGDFAARWYYDEEDVWRAVDATVAGHYRLEQTIGNIEFWRNKTETTTGRQ